MVGLGRFGGGRGLVRELLSQGRRVRLFDREPLEKLGEALRAFEGIGPEKLRVICGAHRLEDFAGVQLCYLNPAVPWEGELARGLRKMGVRLSSDLELFMDSWKGGAIGITGTNGKSTLWEILSRLLPDWAAGGNRGVSVFEMEREGRPGAILELSSFQLERISSRFPIAAVTVFTQDHLDHHGGMEIYKKAKQRLLDFQKPEDFAVLGRGLLDWSAKGRRLDLGVSLRLEESQLKFPDGFSMDVARFPLKGPHNMDLLALGMACAREALKSDTLLLERFKALCTRGMEPLPHRQNVVSTHPFTVVDDSKSTTPESTLCALDAFGGATKGLHLIAGGEEKGLDITPMMEALRGVPAKVYVIGRQTPRWQAHPLTREVPWESCGDLESAVRRAAASMGPGDRLLLSPGTSSLDQFKDYRERGRRFREYVERHLRVSVAAAGAD